MTAGWRSLEPPPTGDWYEFEKPSVTEAINIDPHVDRVTLAFTDSTSRQWYAEWLRTRAAWEAFKAWAGERS